MWTPLFIAGCPRSGTTALRNVISIDKDIFIGMERYYFRAALNYSLSPDLFEKDRFFDLRNGDTFWNDLNVYAGGQGSFAGTTFRGDKIPKLYRHFDKLFNSFTNCRVLFIYRNIIDVAASYNARARNEQDKLWSRQQDYRVAINDWNESLNFCIAGIHSGYSILPICYERFFSSQEQLLSLYHYLQIPPKPEVLSSFNGFINKSADLTSSRKDSLMPEEKAQILLEADFSAYRLLMSNSLCFSI